MIRSERMEMPQVIAPTCIPGHGAPYCQECAVRKLALFAALQEEDFGRLNNAIEDLRFSNDDVLFEEGEQITAVYTIKVGLVKLDRVAAHGKRRAARLAQRGELIGMESCLPALSFYRATAIGNVRVCRIPVDVLNSLQEQIPALRQAILEHWYHALRETDDWSALFGAGSAATRLARLLLKLANPQFQDTFYLPRRGDLGMLIGTRLETTSRLIAAFIRDGLMERVGSNFYRLNRAAMQARACPLESDPPRALQIKV